MQTTSKARLGWVTAIAFLCLFLLGLIDNLKGPTLTPLLKDMQFSDAQGGSIMLWAYIGFLSASLLVGVLSDMVGNRAVVLATAAFLLIGVLGYSIARQFFSLALFMTLLGVGLGCTDMAGNLIIIAYYPQNKGRYLNFMAFFHGLSSTISPYYAGLLLAAGISWRQVYQYPLAAVALLLVMGLFTRFPQPQAQNKSGMEFRSIGRILMQPGIGWYFAVMILYVAAEIGIAAWLVTYLQRIHNLGVSEGSIFLSLYFAGLMIGRLLGSLFVERIGYLRSILIMSACATLCIAAGLFGPGNAYWMLPLTGLFFSVIFPTLTAAASNQVTENVGTLMGLLFAFCGVGGALGPWLIGVVSTAAGIQAGFAVNLLTCAGTALGAWMLLRSAKSRAVSKP
jgi:fucose permease